MLNASFFYFESTLVKSSRKLSGTFTTYLRISFVFLKQAKFLLKDFKRQEHLVFFCLTVKWSHDGATKFSPKTSQIWNFNWSAVIYWEMCTYKVEISSNCRVVRSYTIDNTTEGNRMVSAKVWTTNVLDVMIVSPRRKVCSYSSERFQLHTLHILCSAFQTLKVV